MFHFPCVPAKPLLILLFSVASAISGVSGTPHDTLLPDIPYESTTDRTHIFTRAQFKFGLRPEDYYNRYIDRPLFLDSLLTDDYARFRQDLELAHTYGLDGFAFFPANSQCLHVYGFVQQTPKSKILFLTEFTPSTPEETQIANAGKALATGNSFRIDDKIVITSYNADTKPPAFWKQLMEKVEMRYGDRFLFIPDVTHFADIPISTWLMKFHDKTITESDISKAKAWLREWLKATDGIYFSSVTILRDNERNFDVEFYRDFVIRLMKSVLAEPEFEGKYFGLSAKIGHENHTRMGRTLSSNGTKTLRHSLGAAIDAQPDLINIPEWDEFNESTCFMPTIYDGRSSERIIRYYSARSGNTPLKPIEQDDTTLPNLILSYRKLLTMGEKLELEVLNVPDELPTPEKTKPYEVQVELLTPEGQIVYSSQKLSFERALLSDQTLTLPSESLSQSLLLQPRLTITESGTTRIIQNGLHYLKISPTWYWDYKWVKQPIRDLIFPTESIFRLVEREGKSQIFAEGTLQTDEPLASLELLENGNVVHSTANDPFSSSWQESDEHVLFSFAWKSGNTYRDPQPLKGEIRVEGLDAPPTWLLPRRSDSLALPPEENSFRISFENYHSNIATKRILLRIPRKEIDAAKIVVQFQDNPPTTLKASQLIEKRAYAFSGRNNLSLLCSHFTRQYLMPPPLLQPSARFSVALYPDTQDSVYHLQGITRSGKFYRSQPILLSGKVEADPLQTISLYSDHARTSVSAKVSASTTPTLDYQFEPDRGNLLWTSAGRGYSGVLGSYTTLLTERGASPGDGAPFLNHEHPGLAQKTAPDWIKLENGKYALEFDGKASYITLPQGVIPRRSGYSISMEIKPKTLAGKQVLLANFSHRFGTLAISHEDGAIKARFLHDMKDRQMQHSQGLDPRLKLKEGQWQTLIVTYDQAVLKIALDGKSGVPIPIAGPGMHDTTTVVGGLGAEWFHGQLRRLTIQHHTPVLENAPLNP